MDQQDPRKEPQSSFRGLYRHVKISVKTLDIMIIGVLLLQIIFTGLTYLSVDQNLLFIVKGLIILVACAIDMRKYLVRK